MSGRKQAEVNDIIKQKFLAELGKLLTFMYEEDRQTALAMYSKMFDDARDERDLVHFLISPTRQAVVIARTYNARMRKLQVESQSREQDGAEAEAAPDFVLAIDQLYRQYFPAEEENSQVLEDQYSLFEESEQPVQEDAGRRYPEYTPHPAQTAAQDDAVQAVAETVQEMEASAAPAASTAEAVEEVFDAAKAENNVQQSDVDSFLEEYSNPAVLPPEDEAAAEEPPVYPDEEEDGSLYPEDEPEPARKPRVFLLILFVLLAVPITLAGVVLLLIPTLLFLALAAACIVAGAAVLVAAFSGFQILADFLLLFGAAVVLLALGLLSLWLFVWFIGGAIAGLISGVISLGQSWCYKEVAA